LQVPFDDTVEDWPDDRIREELRTRLAYARNLAESYIGPPLGWPMPAEQ
jgi:hypothetical protein